MEPQLFKWGAEEGEQNLKALPYVINWFERATGVAVADEEEEQYNPTAKRDIPICKGYATVVWGDNYYQDG